MRDNSRPDSPASRCQIWASTCRAWVVDVADVADDCEDGEDEVGMRANVDFDSGFDCSRLDADSTDDSVNVVVVVEDGFGSAAVERW